MKNIIFLEGQNSNSDFTKAKDYFFYKAALEVFFSSDFERT